MSDHSRQWIDAYKWQLLPADLEAGVEYVVVRREHFKALVAVAEAGEAMKPHWIVDMGTSVVHLDADCCGQALDRLFAALDALKQLLETE